MNIYVGLCYSVVLQLREYCDKQHDKMHVNHNIGSGYVSGFRPDITALVDWA